MLKEYKNIEPLVYGQMKKILKKELNHAYIFNMNDNIYSEQMVLSFVKNVMCKEHDTEEEYKTCPICKRIDEGNYLELKLIKPDGLWIKKDQLDELQHDFSTKSLESDKRIYIIYEAEKLNKNSANSLLKFLEEPKDGIIAILLTNNINLVMDTIVSRCQLMTFNKNKVEDYISFNKIEKNKTLNKIAFSIFRIDDPKNISEEVKLFLDNCIKFIKNYEDTGYSSIITVKSYISDYMEDKIKLINFFNFLIMFYRDILGYKINKKTIYFEDYTTLIKKISENNTINKIENKIDVILKMEKVVKNNANTNLLIDKMILDMEE